MSEDLVIRHCAPTLAGIKTGNLFSCACPCKAALTKELCRLNRKLVPKGIRALRMMCDGYSCREISAHYDTTPNNITAWMSKARKYLASFAQLSPSV